MFIESFVFKEIKMLDCIALLPMDTRLVPVTTSVCIAEKFNMNHNDVLKKIYYVMNHNDALNPSFVLDNFIMMINEKDFKPIVLLTKSAFSLTVASFKNTEVASEFLQAYTTLENLKSNMLVKLEKELNS